MSRNECIICGCERPWIDPHVGRCHEHEAEYQAIREKSRQATRYDGADDAAQ